MDSPPVCPSCGSPCLGGVRDRMVTDSCGHSKCRRCLLVEEDSCSQCRLIPRSSVIVRTPAAQEGSSPAHSRASTADSAHSDNSRAAESVSSLVGDWVSSQDFPLSQPGLEELEELEMRNHDDVIERGKLQGERFASEISSALEVTRDSGKPAHIVQRVDLEGNMSYTCTVCKRDFSHRTNLRYHAGCGTGSAGSHPCELCSQVFRSSSHLTYHIRSVHTHERPFQCTVCKKSFHQSVKLKRHSLLHTGERPFPCDICNKSFNTNYHLKEHRNIHTTELHHPCDICEKRFADSCNLRRHVKLFHSSQKFSCEVADCRKEVVSKYEYDQHLKDHRSVQTFSFSCKFCDKGFRDRTDLKRHESTHHNSKKFSCEVCDQPFSRRDHLKRHLRRHHGAGSPVELEVLAPPDRGRVPRLVPPSVEGDVDDPGAPQGMDWEPSQAPHLAAPDPPAPKFSPIVGSINSLPEAIYSPCPPLAPNSRAQVKSQITDLLQGITRSELRAVVARIDRADERETLEKILKTAKITVMDIKNPDKMTAMDTKNPEMPDRQPQTNNVKKNLLHRYRKQSGYACEPGARGADLSSSLASVVAGTGIFEMPDIEVNSSQREAAARALTEWWEQRRARLPLGEGGGEEQGGKLPLVEGKVEEQGVSHAGGHDGTVIKVTPSGLRKITFFEGERN